MTLTSVAVANINSDLPAYVAHVINIKGHPDLFFISVSMGCFPQQAKKEGSSLVARANGLQSH